MQKQLRPKIGDTIIFQRKSISKTAFIIGLVIDKGKSCNTFKIKRLGPKKSWQNLEFMAHAREIEIITDSEALTILLEF